MDIERITLLRDNIIVRREKMSDKSSSGLLYLPPVYLDAKVQANKHPAFKAKVLRVGPGLRAGKNESVFVETKLRPGDQVLVGRYGADVVKELGNDVFIMSERDVMAVLEDDVQVGAD
jgi:co-chaperonin GroES (HSP10)